jgi:hypothetical protein
MRRIYDAISAYEENKITANQLENIVAYELNNLDALG